MKKVALFFFIFTCQFSLKILSQNISIGPEFGFVNRNDVGVNIIEDSLIVMTDGNVGNYQNNYGIFLDYNISKKFDLHATIGYNYQINGYLVYNRYESLFGFPPVVKASSVASHNFNLLLSLQYKIFEVKGVGLSIMAGLRPSFLVNIENELIEFRNGSRHQGTAELINNLDESNRNVNTTYNIGLQISYWRLHLTASYEANLPNSSYTESISYFQKKYPLYNSTSMLVFSVRYDLFRFNRIF